MSKVSFKNWSWDTTDLIQCKNTLSSLLIEGHDESVIRGLDFGSLDVDGVIDEDNEYQLNAYEAEHC
jgi:hypothetical protein